MALAKEAEALGEQLVRVGWRLVTAESCTGGWIAKVATDVAGSSNWFEGGLVTYSDTMKQAQLGVRAATLREFGAVSEAVVKEMAAGACAATGGSVAVAVSGVAGPDGGSVDKPVGTVWFGFSIAAALWAERVVFAGGRDAVRRQTVGHALTRLREKIGG